MQIPDHSFVVRRKGQEARLRLFSLPLVETFQFGGEFAIAAKVNVEARWQAKGEFIERGEGSDADPTSPTAFTGEFAEASCTSKVTGVETGFSFETGELTAETFYAGMGEEMNGSFLS
ncbi:hypothetical protein KFU94_33820 [Chloroflexi bacterium TSY]|nr:hypothetical protein [Chloroflexi bacterium TSY]